MFFDSHCHLNYYDEWEPVRDRAVRAGVTKMMCVGTDIEKSKKAIGIAEADPDHIAASIGIHPTEKDGKNNIETLKTMAGNDTVKAIGEVGLDYFHVEDSELKDRQKEFLIQVIELANIALKPLIFHCRDAYQDFYDLVAQNMPKNGAVMHFYIGSAELLAKFLGLGFYIGYSGVITFPNTDVYLKNVNHTPLDRILIETDAPFVAPQAYRGKQNEPAYVIEVAKRIAEIKNISIDEVAQATAENASKLFGLNP